MISEGSQDKVYEPMDYDLLWDVMVNYGPWKEELDKVAAKEMMYFSTVDDLRAHSRWFGLFRMGLTPKEAWQGIPAVIGKG